MGLFDRGGLSATERAELAEALGGAPRALAWGRTDGGRPVVGLADRLAIRDPEGWRCVAWQAIDRGGWDPATARLRWTCGGVDGGVHLTETGQLPDLFRERVAASIVLQQAVELGGRKRATISARRDPGAASGPIEWRVALPAGDLDADQRRVLDAEVGRLRAEYDIA